MAKIILEPNETFEHFHKVESESQLLQGEVIFKMGNSSFSLECGQTVKIPANKIHSMKNIGSTVAIVDCAHQEADPVN